MSLNSRELSSLRIKCRDFRRN